MWSLSFWTNQDKLSQKRVEKTVIKIMSQSKVLTTMQVFMKEIYLYKLISAIDNCPGLKSLKVRIFHGNFLSGLIRNKLTQAIKKHYLVDIEVTIETCWNKRKKLDFVLSSKTVIPGW